MHERILVVDERQWRTCAQQILEEAGFTVEVLSSYGPDTLRAVVQRGFDLVVIGCEAVSPGVMTLASTLSDLEMRFTVHAANTPGADETRELFFKLHAMDVVGKRIDASEFLSVITEALSKPFRPRHV